jgi:membrane fusion protein (multidrug efflux system)
MTRGVMTTRTRRWLTMAALLAVAAMMSLAGCGQRSGGQQGAEEERVPVETVVAERSMVSPVLEYSGTVLPEKKALLGASIQGAIEKFHVDAGDKVAEGDLLVELASEQLTQAEAAYVAAKKDWERMSDLLAKAATTQQVFDRTEAAYRAAEAAYEMVLESSRIRAPFDGVVTQRFFDEGEVYVMMPVSASSPAILELAEFDRVKVEAEIAEHERAQARVGLHAVVTLDALPGRTFRGTLERIDPSLDQRTRTSTADIIVDNPGHVIMPGMFAKVELTLAEKAGLLLTRDAMIRQEGTGSFYAYVVKNGVAERRNLTLGDSFGERVEVLGGLDSGDVVVTAGRYKLHDGAKVYEPDRGTQAGGQGEGQGGAASGGDSGTRGATESGGQGADQSGGATS